MTFRRLLLLAALTSAASGAIAQQSEFTVDIIMQDPETWIGDWPSDPTWAEDGSALYFNWNPGGAFPADSLFKVPRNGAEPIQVTPEERRTPLPRFTGWEHGSHIYDRSFRRKVYVNEGDIYVYDRASDETNRLTSTLASESNPRFTSDGSGVVFSRDNNLYIRHLSSGLEEQVTDLRSGSEASDDDPDPQDAFLRDQQQELIGYLRQQAERRAEREAAQERDETARRLPPTFYHGDKRVQNLQLAPGGRYVTFLLSERLQDPRDTRVQAFVTESGYTEDLDARPKVGAPQAATELYVQDIERDTTYLIDLHQLPGSYDVPLFRQELGVTVDSAATQRQLFAYGPYWSGDGEYAVVEVRAADNKTRWIARLHPASGDLTVLDRQHDEAWIAGPGISSGGGASTLGWMPDNRRIYFQSEASGYSHLYTADVASEDVRQLTSGNWEVFDPVLSRDGRTWYFASSEHTPFERHYYSMPSAGAGGASKTRLSSLEGMNEFALDPAEEMLGILHSYTTSPPEIYLQPMTGNARRITHSPTDEWQAYPWREGEIIEIPASDALMVPAQIFRPENPNGAAVLFVHGAGYLQNVHRGWSSYFREYMFHNLLADLGYTVLNVDYRASSGYGRDWRTAIYRHMGGRDLQDYVDASRFVENEYEIPPERVFIYGGSYGGFITMMALFTAPDRFGGGAALRSVTDWAHYNHPYTSNILNLPAEDTLAYRRSSPIYFAEGLEDPLLIAHGMVDVNVQFQDVVRLAQRLIELGKEDWEMAVYPVEDHAFTEPESWADEYRRILKYIRISVGPEEDALQEVPVLRNEAARAPVGVDTSSR